MKRSYVSTILMTPLIACLLVILGCNGETTTDEPTGRPITGLAALADLPLRVVAMKGSSGCVEEKPDDIGCTTMCKPCVTFVCREGEWESLDIGFPDEICDPPDIPSGPGPFGCPRTPEGFCPAECSFCF